MPSQKKSPLRESRTDGGPKAKIFLLRDRHDRLLERIRRESASEGAATGLARSEVVRAILDAIEATPGLSDAIAEAGTEDAVSELLKSRLRQRKR